MTNLDKLPVAATFTAKSGQASLQVQVQNDTVYVEAICDSLIRQCEIYEMELSRVRHENQLQFLKVEKTNVSTAFHWCLRGFLIGLIVSIIIFKYFKK